MLPPSTKQGSALGEADQSPSFTLKLITIFYAVIWPSYIQDTTTTPLAMLTINVTIPASKRPAPSPVKVYKNALSSSSPHPSTSRTNCSSKKRCSPYLQPSKPLLINIQGVGTEDTLFIYLRSSPIVITSLKRTKKPLRLSPTLNRPT